MTGEAFAQAVQTYGDTVYRVAFHALNSREDAEDVMQTVMLKLFEYDKEFESEAHLKHWLLRVSVNESRKLLRSFWRRVSVPLDDWRELEIEIRKVKRFGIKPMFPEDAVLEVELLGHDFFVFANADEDCEVNVVYRRKKGGYGLIRPEFE